MTILSTSNLPGIPITDEDAQVRNRFLDFGNRDYTTDTSFLRGTAELDGKINSDWSWVADAVYNTSDQVAIYSNQILNSALVDGIHEGLINLTAIHQDPTLIQEAALFGNAEVLAHAKLLRLPTLCASTAVSLDLARWLQFTQPQAWAISKESTQRYRRRRGQYHLISATGSSSWNNGVSGQSVLAAERTI